MYIYTYIYTCSLASLYLGCLGLMLLILYDSCLTKLLLGCRLARCTSQSPAYGFEKRSHARSPCLTRVRHPLTGVFIAGTPAS